MVHLAFSPLAFLVCMAVLSAWGMALESGPFEYSLTICAVIVIGIPVANVIGFHPICLSIPIAASYLLYFREVIWYGGRYLTWIGLNTVVVMSVLSSAATYVVARGIFHAVRDYAAWRKRRG